MVPPEVSAVMRAPRRACKRRCTASRCRYPARGPSRVLKPSHNMRTTLSKVARLNPANGHARRTSANSASSSQSSHAASATICCASTSSGAGTMRKASSSPRRMLSSSAAHSTSSSRVCGNRRALGVPPTLCPERPARCRKVAIERGEPSWQTRSTSPISSPSSSEAVATNTVRSPALSRCSASRRVSRDRLP